MTRSKFDIYVGLGDIATSYGMAALWVIEVNVTRVPSGQTTRQRSARHQNHLQLPSPGSLEVVIGLQRPVQSWRSHFEAIPTAHRILYIEEVANFAWGHVTTSIIR